MRNCESRWEHARSNKHSSFTWYLEQLNELAELVADIQSKGEGMKYKAVLVIEKCNNLDSAMDIVKNMDCYEIRFENSAQYAI